MKKSLLTLAGFLTLSYMPLANAYTLDLPENAVFKSKECKLVLGDKKFRKADNFHNPAAMIYEAVLVTPYNQYQFVLEDLRGRNDQQSFGRFPKETFATFPVIERTSDDAIDLRVITENWTGQTGLIHDCGTMTLK